MSMAVCESVCLSVREDIKSIKSNLFVTQNYTIPIKDGKIEQCVNRNHTRDLYQFFCACCLCPWLGPPPACWR